MRISRLDINKINFNYCFYSESLYESIKRIGLSFPIKVTIIDDKYYCTDGHKRLSALIDILNNEKDYPQLANINIIIVNDGSNRSNDCWRPRNIH